MKIAPTLRSWVEDDGKWSDMHRTSTDAQRQAQAELRALLRVARAARRLHWYYGGSPASTYQGKLFAALASLDRASGGER
jgi:hypothetical protein